MRWASKIVPLSHLLEGQYVGLEGVGDGIWNIYLQQRPTGTNERILRVEDALGRRMRNTHSSSQSCGWSDDGPDYSAAGEADPPPAAR